jgi:hypothetical protein
VGVTKPACEPEHHNEPEWLIPERNPSMNIRNKDVAALAAPGRAVDSAVAAVEGRSVVNWPSPFIADDDNWPSPRTTVGSANW